jgi:hypothetical protein
MAVFKLSGLIGPNDPSVSFARAHVFYCVLTDHLFDAYLCLYRLKTSCFQPVLCQPLILVPSSFLCDVTVLVSRPTLAASQISLICLDTWYNCFGRVISPSQRPLPTHDNTTQKDEDEC